MKTLFFVLILMLSQAVYGQYYYNDIKGARDFGDKIKSYITNKVKSVRSIGYDDRGVQTNEFGETQDINSENNIFKIAIASRTGQQVARQFYQFDDQYRLTRITDSSRDIKSVTVYSYDGGSHLISIKTSITDTDSTADFSETEEHQWFYNNAGKPAKMLRILNSKDSTEYKFTIDEKGNVADEQLMRRGQGIDPVYYYYDENNNLTDVVRFDKKVKQLMPDMMFEYDDKNQMIQKITTLSTINRDYLIWRYAYNEMGLKTREALYNKQKELTGRIDYTYTFY